MALGSVLGTIKDAVDIRRELGERVGVVGITCSDLSAEAVREALRSASPGRRLEKAFSVGFGGVLSTDVAMSMHGEQHVLRSVVAGTRRARPSRDDHSRSSSPRPCAASARADFPRPRSRCG